MKIYNLFLSIITIFILCSCDPLFDYIKCDRCGYVYDNDYQSTSYCPRCGWSNYNNCYRHSYYYDYYEWCPYCRTYHYYEGVYTRSTNINIADTLINEQNIQESN